MIDEESLSDMSKVIHDQGDRVLQVSPSRKVDDRGRCRRALATARGTSISGTDGRVDGSSIVRDAVA